MFHVNGNTADVTLAAVGAVPNANGASLTGQQLTLQPASADQPGVMTASDKSKLDAVTGTHTGSNTGDVTLAAMGSTANANGATLTAQALNLQPASAAYAGAMSAAHYTKLDAMSSQLAAAARAFFVENPAAKGANNVHANFAGNTASVKAEKELAGLGDGKLDTVIDATTAGAAGNSITLAATADGSGTGTLLRSGTAFVFHFEAGVTTVANFETLVAALAGGDDLFGVKTGGTGGTALVSGSAFVATALAGGIDGNAFPGAFTSPDVPRNLRITFDATWNAGDVNVVGTDQYNAAVNETFADNPGNVVVGTKIFKTVTSATKESVGGAAGPASIGTGDKLGVATPLSSAFGILAVDGVTEPVTVDATLDAFTPGTNVPNGARDYVLVANV